MPPKTAAYKPAMSDDAVQAKTGKKWAEWFALLDADGAARLDHKGIVALLHDKYGVGSWWQQMVTVTYEQARGRRERHETPAGYQVSVSRTVSVPVARLYAAWKDARARASWLGEPTIAVRKATPEKSLRLTWLDGQTNVDVGFYAKGANKAQVAVQHSKLPNAAAVKRQKAYWAAALDRLKEHLEG